MYIHPLRGRKKDIFSSKNNENRVTNDLWIDIAAQNNEKRYWATCLLVLNIATHHYILIVLFVMLKRHQKNGCRAHEFRGQLVAPPPRCSAEGGEDLFTVQNHIYRSRRCEFKSRNELEIGLSRSRNHPFSCQNNPFFILHWIAKSPCIHRRCHSSYVDRV